MARAALIGLLLASEGAAAALAQDDRAGPADERLEVLAQAWRDALQTTNTAAIYEGGASYADALREQARTERAQAVLHRTLDALAAVDPRQYHRPWVLHQLADMARVAQRWGEAFDLLDQAQASLWQGEHARYHDRIRCFIQDLRGKNYLGMGLIDQAAPLIFEARDGARELLERGENDRGLRLSVQINLAKLRMATASYEELIAEVESVLRETELFEGRKERHRPQLLVKLGIAHLELARDDPAHAPEAEAIFRQVIEDQATVPPDRLQAELRLAYLLLRQARFEEARILLEETRAAERFAVSATDRALLAALEARWSLESGAADLGARRVALTDAYDRLLEDWEASPPREGGQAFLSYASTEMILSEVVRLELATADHAADGIERALEQLLRAQRLGTLVRAIRPNEAGVAAIRAELCVRGTGILVYFPSKDRTHVFGIGRERLVHAETVGDWDLERLRYAFVSQVIRPPSTLVDESSRERRRRRVRENGEALARALFPGEIRSFVRVHSALSVVGTDLLGYLPFECLPFEDGELLGLDKSVGYLSSLALGAALAQREGAEAPRPKDLLLVAGPVHGREARERFPDISTLPFDDRALEELTGAYRPERVDALLGADATLEKLRDGRLQRARVLQFFVHGVYDASRERAAGLVLGGEGEGWLLVSDRVERLAVPPLVILSACASLRGPERAGDPDAGHLGGAFLEAGARAVILPEADLAFRPTLLLARRLHRELLRGLSPAEALRQARRKLVETEEWSDPFYHSLLHVTGLAHVPVFSASESGAGAGPASAFRWGLAGLGLVVVLVAVRARSRNRAA